MSRELMATLISAAMIALVFIVAAQTDGRLDPKTGPVLVFGVELDRAATRQAVSDAAVRLNEGAKAEIMRRLAITEAELATERERILDERLKHSAFNEEEFTQYIRALEHLERALALMPAQPVTDMNAQKAFIAALELPDGTEEGVFHSLLAANPEQRESLADELERWAGEDYEEFVARNTRDLRTSLLQQAEIQALRSMICERAERSGRKITPARYGSREVFGVRMDCAFFAMQYVERLLEEELPEETALRGKVLSEIALARAP